jgi:hypothetical protein
MSKGIFYCAGNMIWRIIRTTTLVVLIAGCQDGSSAKAPYGTADLFNAGDRTLTLSEEPILTLGQDDALPLHRITGAVFFGDGVAIANSGTNEVIVVDENGHVTARHGRRGDGPGEYRNLAGVARHGEGLVTWDAYHLRLSRLDRDANYIGGAEERIEVPLYHDTDIVGAFGNSVLLRFEPRGFRDGAAEPQVIRQNVEVVIADVVHGRVSLRLKLPGKEQWGARRGTTHGGPPVIFGRTLATAVAHDAAIVADTDALTFQVFNRSGTRTDVSLDEYGSGLVATAEWEAQAREAERASAEAKRDPLIRQFGVDLLEGLPARHTLPAFSGMIGDRDGLLWIQEYPRPLQQIVTWVALDEKFSPRHTLQVPLALQVLDVSGDRVLVRSSGPLGEELIEVYEVRR